MCVHTSTILTSYIIGYRLDHCYSFPPQILPEADHPRTVEGQSREKRKRLAKSAAGCPFYKPGPLENFRDLALVCSSTNLHRTNMASISLESKHEKESWPPWKQMMQEFSLRFQLILINLPSVLLTSGWSSGHRAAGYNGERVEGLSILWSTACHPFSRGGCVLVVDR